jgi:hypothetical protein
MYIQMKLIEFSFDGSVREMDNMFSAVSNGEGSKIPIRLGY